MKRLRAIFLGIFCANFALAGTINDFSLPSTITLNAGETRTDTAISTPSSTWVASTFYYNEASSGANFTLNGGVGSKYTLNINDNTTTFYANAFTIGQNANLELSGFHTINFASSVSVGQNAAFTIINSGNTLSSAQGSDYGKRSKIRFGSKNATLNLAENSRVLFTYTLFFMSDASVVLGANSQLEIISANAARFQNKFTNNGGSASFGGLVNGTMINTDVYNIGSPTSLANAKNTTATFTNNGGNIVVNGDFYNGGQAVTDVSGAFLDTFDPPFGGGGNLVLNGGTMRVTGQLISQRGGTLYYGGELGDVQNSSISIYGATLIVEGGLQNKQGSTLTFGFLNDKMGVLQGNLSNENGAVAVDISNLKSAGTYQIITGAISGLADSAVSITNPNPSFLTATYSSGSVSVVLTSGGEVSPPVEPEPEPEQPNPPVEPEPEIPNPPVEPEPEPVNPPVEPEPEIPPITPPTEPENPTPYNPSTPSAFDEYKSTLNANQNAIASSLLAKFGGNFPLLTSVENIQTALADTDKALKNAAVTQPKSLINAFRGDALLAPIQNAFVSRRLAAASSVRTDTRRVRVLVAKPSRDFYLAPVGAVLSADGTSGYVAGFTLGSNYKMGALTNRIYAAYAYGAARQDLSSQSSDTTAHLLQLGTLNRYAQGIWEFDINANFLFGAFVVDNEWQQAALNSSSKFNNYQLNLGLLAGARFGKTLSIKPFVGIENYAEMQSAFKSILGFEAQGYKAYVLGGVAGVEGHYLFSKNSAVYGKIGFENRLYNSHKHLFLRSLNNEISYENKAYDNALSLNLGAQLFAWGRFRLNLEGAFKHYNSGLDYYGGNLGFRWRL